MYLPQINEISQNRDVIDVFGGYNHSMTVRDGEFYEMTNLTSDDYPAVSVRKKRKFVKKIDKPNGLFYTDTLVYVDGTELFYDGVKVLDVSDSEKTLVAMGAYLCVFPDKVIFNTEDGTSSSMEAHYTNKGVIRVEPSTLGGSSLEYSETEPEHADGAYWLDNGVLKQWSQTYSAWMSVPTSYVRIYETLSGKVNEEFTDMFREGDTVSFTGFKDEDLNGDFVLYACADGYMVIGCAPKNIAESSTVNFDRSVPDMDFVCEQNNRLWGCSSKNHEIYASKLGDPTNWRSYAGLVSDSYAVTVGSYGDFTGCISHLGYVLFFKEGMIIRMYGSQPSDFSKTEIICRGVEKGSEKSLAVLNEVLYYKSKDGICAYDGTFPRNISQSLGDGRYTHASAGVTNNKYVVSALDADGNWNVFVYDYQKGVWAREDNEHMLFFANEAGTLYYMNEYSLNLVQSQNVGEGIYPSQDFYIDGEMTSLYPGMVYPGQAFEDDYEEPIEWSAQTGDMGTGYPDNKYVSKIVLRLSVEPGGLFEMEVQYDSDGLWEKILSLGSTSKRSVSVPVRLRRCDHFSFRFSGSGRFRLYSITKSIEQGSEL